MEFIDNKEIKNDEKETNGEQKTLKSRMFRHNQRETNLTPLIEGNNTDIVD